MQKNNCKIKWILSVIKVCCGCKHCVEEKYYVVLLGNCLCRDDCMIFMTSVYIKNEDRRAVLIPFIQNETM